MERILKYWRGSVLAFKFVGIVAIPGFVSGVLGAVTKYYTANNIVSTLVLVAGLLALTPPFFEIADRIVEESIKKDLEEEQRELERVNELLEKYKNQELTEEEAQELIQLLERRKAKKEQEGKEADAMFISLVILGVLAYLANKDYQKAQIEAIPSE